MREGGVFAGHYGICGLIIPSDSISASTLLRMGDINFSYKLADLYHYVKIGLRDVYFGGCPYMHLTPAQDFPEFHMTAPAALVSTNNIVGKCRT